jgi:D-glycero-D-manno-heptose 1,7-bisphosphate phosphatase
VADRPFLAHLIVNARRFGFNDVILLAGFMSEKVSEFAQQLEAELGIRIRVVSEPFPAGTAGALTFAQTLLADEFLMLNGDSMFDFDWLGLALSGTATNWVAKLGLRQVPDCSRFGSIDLCGERVIAFREKVDSVFEGLINGGVYWLRRTVLEEISVAPCSLERDVFPKLVERGQVQGFISQGGFIDIGVPDELSRARSDWAQILKKPAAFFDRDGVLNHDDGYTYRIADFSWKIGAREAILMCNQLGILVFVVTNQAGIARGLYNEEAVEMLHTWMNTDLREIGAHIDDFRFCPHHPKGVVPALSTVCKCRKPAPGMINDLLASWPVEKRRSFLVGDKPSDVEAARAAGISGHLIGNSENLLEVTKGLIA